MTRPARVKDDEWKEEVDNKNSDESDEDVDISCTDKSSYDYKFKICLLGESGVGKTSLIQRYINNKFDDDCTNDDDKNDDELNFNRVKSTIGVDCLTTVKIMRGHKICVEIWDTAGQGL